MLTKTMGRGRRGQAGHGPSRRAPGNRFAQPIPRISRQEHELGNAAALAAQLTFDTVADDPDSHYYCAPGLTPQHTAQAITRQVGLVNGRAAIYAARDVPLTPTDYEALHRAIFEPAFGTETLHQRQPDEDVQYGVTLGRREKPVDRSQVGAGGARVRPKLARMTREFDRAVEARKRELTAGAQRHVIDATRPAARLYGKFLATHPFWDGNGRTAYPVLTQALIRMGLLAVAITESRDFHWALGRGMQRSGRASYEPLARYIEQIIVRSHSA